MGVSNSLRKFRESYIASTVLVWLATPIEQVCGFAVRQIHRKIKKNGVPIVLPNGRQFVMARDAGISMATALFWHGIEGFEPQTCRTLRFFFAHAKSFIDAGANVGYYSILGALLNPEMTVVAFEPAPDIAEKLKRNVRVNGLDGRVMIEQLALSNTTGVAVIYLPEDSTTVDVATTGTLAQDSWQQNKGAREIRVATARFDDLARERSLCPDLIKIDVEDFEADVISGMRDTLRILRSLIVCEILMRKHRNERTRAVLQELGYTAYWITPAAYVRVSSFDFDRGPLQDFVLSPVDCGELVTDAAVFLNNRTTPSIPKP